MGGVLVIIDFGHRGGADILITILREMEIAKN
jgi:hypothetical protein